MERQRGGSAIVVVWCDGVYDDGDEIMVMGEGRGWHARRKE